MNELIGIITKDEFLSDDLIKDVLFILGGKKPIRLGETGCQFSPRKKMRYFQKFESGCKYSSKN